MIWNTLRYLISFFLPVFYKRTQSKNIKNIKVKGPVIIAMNHPNAFTDPVYFSYLVYPQRVSYLARGDAFRPGMIANILEGIGIVPIFRLRDGGKEGLKKNDETYRRVNYLLSKNSKIIVFAEGLCVQERRLRPLKKGVARMVFGAYEAINSDKLIVVPVGVNYNKPDKFRSNLFYNVGEPIAIKDFIPDFKENQAKAYTKFLQVLEPKMKELITHIDERENDELVYQVEELCKKDMIKAHGLNYRNLDHDFVVLTELTEKVNKATKTQPNELSELRTLSKNYFHKLKKNNLKDWLINPKQNKQVNAFSLLIRSLLLILFFPIHLIGLIGNYLPFTLTHKLTVKNIKNVEFYSSIAIGIGMFVFWINYIVIFIGIYIFSPTVFYPLIICIVLILCGFFSLYYRPFFKKTIGIYTVLKNKALLTELGEERKKLISIINKF
ncbi:1-acyl-sn-glycerol-3-phosphate acyltransferase [Aurantibacillus circumpalustris]|uniref:1-acyl-sn-glycerol-3-phosphate acyltransferase n=1 Tax=Aurantibacillus circumpalustris TaxID=3036359 RepID=UPI00295BE800|nr:1-acyl-sn-glycerol-3-phosphate acyltransferase [Aurantibacillus circumpalustris]